jgi:Transmembrane amino acid transporter protein
MAAVTKGGSLVAIIVYVIVGIFGYLTFAGKKTLTSNILEAPYGVNPAIYIANIAIYFSVLCAAPLCILPAKDTLEEVFYKERGMNKR